MTIVNMYVGRSDQATIYISMDIMSFVYVFFIRRDTYEISSAQHAIKVSMEVKRVIQVHLVSLGDSAL